MPTNDPADRVKRFRTEYLDRQFARDTDAQRDAYEIGVGFATQNALAAIEQGDPTEAVAWATLANVVSFRYRKAF